MNTGMILSGLLDKPNYFRSLSITIRDEIWKYYLRKLANEFLALHCHSKENREWLARSRRHSQAALGSDGGRVRSGAVGENNITYQPKREMWLTIVICNDEEINTWMNTCSNYSTDGFPW